MIYSKKLSFEFYNLIIFSLYGIITPEFDSDMLKTISTHVEMIFNI